MGSTENKIGVDGVFIVEEGKQDRISKIEIETTGKPYDGKRSSTVWERFNN